MLYVTTLYNTTLPESMCLYSYSKKCKMAGVVDFLARKPKLLFMQDRVILQVITQLLVCYLIPLKPS